MREGHHGPSSLVLPVALLLTRLFGMAQASLRSRNYLVARYYIWREGYGYPSACPVLFEIDAIVVVNAKMNPELTFCAGFRAPSCHVFRATKHELEDEAKAFRNFRKDSCRPER